MPTITRLQRLQELDAHIARQMLEIARDTETSDATLRVTGATPAGDEQRLRGIPAIGRGVAGAIHGTRP